MLLSIFIETNLLTFELLLWVISLNPTSKKLFLTDKNQVSEGKTDSQILEVSIEILF